MAQERPNRIIEWVTLLRKNAPVFKEHAREWYAEVREEPRLLWETPAVRYVAYGFGGLIGAWVLLVVVEMITPPPPAGAKEAAVTADFHVVCSDPACGYNFVIQRKFGFDDFPVQCDRCKKPTGQSGRRCYSATCQGRWVAPLRVDKDQKCPACGALFQ